MGSMKITQPFLKTYPPFGGYRLFSDVWPWCGYCPMFARVYSWSGHKKKPRVKVESGAGKNNFRRAPAGGDCLLAKLSASRSRERIETMNTSTSTANGEPDRFTEFNQSIQHGRGRGLASVGDLVGAALAQVEAAPMDWGGRRPLSRRELVTAWYRGEPSDKFGLMAAAVEDQTREDVALVGRFAKLLKTKIEDNGGKVSATMEEEARGAGAAAVVAWRNGALPCPVVPGERVPQAVAVVAWRAVSDELSRDDKGHTVELSTVSDEWLAAAVEPLAVACLAGYEERSDKAARLLRERGAARRKMALPGKMDNLRHGHGRRVQLVERIGAAAARLLGGDSIDAAAAAVGFKARLHGGKVKEQAGVQLARAARAVGLNFALVEPCNGATAADEFNPWRRPLALDGGAAVVPFVPAAAVEPLPLAAARRGFHAEVPSVPSCSVAVTQSPPSWSIGRIMAWWRRCGISNGRHPAGAVGLKTVPETGRFLVL